MMQFVLDTTTMLDVTGMVVTAVPHLLIYQVVHQTLRIAPVSSRW
jgi:hypothetical protein